MKPLGYGLGFGVEFDDRPRRFRSGRGTPGPENVCSEVQATFESDADDRRERPPASDRSR